MYGRVTHLVLIIHLFFPFPVGDIFIWHMVWHFISGSRLDIFAH